MRREGKLIHERTEAEFSEASLDPADANLFADEVDGQGGAADAKTACIHDDDTVWLLPETLAVSVTGNDDASRRPLRASYAGGDCGHLAPDAQHGEETIRRENCFGDAHDARAHSAVVRIVFARQFQADLAKNTKADFEPLHFCSRDVCSVMLNTPAQFGDQLRPRGDLVEKHIAMRDPHAFVRQKHFVNVRNIRVVIAHDQDMFGRVCGKKGVQFAKGFAWIFEHLRIERISIDHETVGAVEERGQSLQVVHQPGGVAVVDVGDDACDERRHASRQTLFSGAANILPDRFLASGVWRS